MRTRHTIEDLSDIRKLQDPNVKQDPSIGPIKVNLAELRVDTDSETVDTVFTLKTFIERLADHAQIDVEIT